MPLSPKFVFLFLLAVVYTIALPTPIYKVVPHQHGKPAKKILVLSENKGHHIAFSKRAIEWLKQLSADSGYQVDYIQDAADIGRIALPVYQLFVQLDYPPYGWGDSATRAFETFIVKGEGAWIGLHHASLLGEFDGYPLWNWFYQFMGAIRFKDYIADFASAEVVVETPHHPIMRGIPPKFNIEKEEWYTYDRSPREQVHVLASVKESSYKPASSKKMGDHPVIWSNPDVKAKNLYIFMGHDPGLFDNATYVQLLRNSICWALSDK